MNTPSSPQDHARHHARFVESLHPGYDAQKGQPWIAITLSTDAGLRFSSATQAAALLDRVFADSHSHTGALRAHVRPGDMKVRPVGRNIYGLDAPAVRADVTSEGVVSLAVVASSRPNPSSEGDPRACNLNNVWRLASDAAAVIRAAAGTAEWWATIDIPGWRGRYSLHTGTASEVRSYKPPFYRFEPVTGSLTSTGSRGARSGWEPLLWDALEQTGIPRSAIEAPASLIQDVSTRCDLLRPAASAPGRSAVQDFRGFRN